MDIANTHVKEKLSQELQGTASDWDCFPLPKTPIEKSSVTEA